MKWLFQTPENNPWWLILLPWLPAVLECCEGLLRICEGLLRFHQTHTKVTGRKHWTAKFSSIHCINKITVAIVKGLTYQRTSSQQGTHIKRRRLALDAACARAPSTHCWWCRASSSRSWAEISNSFHISWYWTSVITTSTAQTWASDLRVKGCSFPGRWSLHFDTTNYLKTVTQSSIKISVT